MQDCYWRKVGEVKVGDGGEGCYVCKDEGEKKEYKIVRRGKKGEKPWSMWRIKEENPGKKELERIVVSMQRKICGKINKTEWIRH